MLFFQSGERIKLMIYLIRFICALLIKYLPIVTLDISQTFLFSRIILHWTISADRKFPDGKIKSHIYKIGIYGLIFMLLRVMRYNYFKSVNSVSLYLWYMYYIPVGMMAYHAFCVAMETSQIQDKVKHAQKILFGVTLLLISFILTNNFHGKAFVIANMDIHNSDYTHGIVYFIMLAWVIFLLLGAFVILVKNCSVKEIKRLMWIPLTVALFMSVYHLLYMFLDFNRERLINFPEAYTFSVLALIETYIWIGLIPSNTDYDGFFSILKVPAYVTDKKLNVFLSSDGSMPEKELLKNAVNGETMTDENHELHSKEIRAGYVFWEEDHTSVNNLNRELESSNEELSEFNDVIAHENTLKERRARIEAKTAIYDRINMSVKSHSDRIQNILSQMSENDEDFDTKLAYLCVLDTYLKRRSNLEILATDSDFIQATELYLSVRESCDYLTLAGKNARCSLRGRGEIDSGILISIYSYFETLCEENFDSIDSLSVTITANRESTNVRIFCDAEEHIKTENKYSDSLKKSGYNIITDTDDGTCVISISSEGGAV